MPTDFPTAVDAFDDPAGNVPTGAGPRTLSERLTDHNDAIEAIEAYLLAGTVERAVDLGNLGAAETIDVSVAPFQVGTLNADVTITMPPVSGATEVRSFTLVLKQDATGGRAVTWVGVALWPNGVEPTPSVGANQRDTWVFKSYLGGPWEGAQVEANIS